MMITHYIYACVSIKNIQSSLNELFGIQSNVSASIMISIGIFVSGLILTETIKAIASFNKRKSTRRIFFLSLEELATRINRQSKSYRNLSNEIKFKSNTNYSIGNVDIFQLTTLKQMGYENLFLSLFTGFENTIFRLYINKKRLKAFNKIWEAIEYVKSWQEKLYDEAEVFNKMFNDENKVREIALKKYFAFIEPELTAGHGQPLDNDKVRYLQIVDNIHQQYFLSNDKTNPYILHRKLTLPIRILNRRNRNVDIVHTSNIHLMDATYAYTNMKNINSVFKDMYFEQGIWFHKYAKLVSLSKRILD